MPYGHTSPQVTGPGRILAPDTVYAAFPGKADLFRHVLDVATVGDEQPVAVVSRPEIQDAFRQPDPRTAISQAIDYTVALFERAGDLIMVTVQAADADPVSRATRQLWRTLTRALHDTGALRPGLTAQAAADILYALASPHTHQLLRRHCSWTTQRYRTWLTNAATGQLLADRPG